MSAKKAMPINSNSKGKRAERAWRDELRAQGYLNARRGQQFSGSPDSPDVICEELSQFYFEVKHVEKLNIWGAYDQAKHDSFGSEKEPLVAHTKNHREWLVTMSSEAFFKLLRRINPPINYRPESSICGCEIYEVCPVCNPARYAEILKEAK